MPDEVRTQHLIDALDRIRHLATHDGGDLGAIRDYCDKLKALAEEFLKAVDDPSEYNRKRGEWKVTERQEDQPEVEEARRPLPGVVDNGC